MNLKHIVLYIALLCNPAYLPAQIRILCTAALIDEGYETRKNEYCQCFDILKSFGYTNPYIVEAIKKSGSTFLDDYSTNVFYSTANNPRLKNKGVNEGRTMLEALKQFHFDPDDMIIKVTGRYHFTSDALIGMIENNPDIDGFVKYDDSRLGIITGCFALRYHYLVDFLEHLDYEHMEKKMVCIEWDFKSYLEQIILTQQAHITFVDKLHIQAKVWGDAGYRPGTSNW